MTAYVLKRVIGALPLLLFITFVSFALMGLAPGGPAAILGSQGHRISPAMQARLAAEMGLDKPWFVQYFYWLTSLVLHGNLGVSYVDHRPVLAKLLEKLPITILVVGLAQIMTIAIALPIGIYAAVKRNSAFDYLSTIISFFLYGVPIFWLGIILIDVFAVQLRWFPVSGMSSLGKEGDLLDRLHHVVLPVAAITIVSLAGWLRYGRASMLEVLDKPYVRTARAKGLSENSVIFKHALRNALMPTITLLGLSLPALIGGAYFVEYIFSIPGMGYLGFNAIFQRDYPTLMGITLFTAILVVAGNLLADIAYAAVDPRVRFD